MNRGQNPPANGQGQLDQAAGQNPQAQPQGPQFSFFKMIMLYLLISYVIQFFSSNKDPKANKQLLSNIFEDQEPIEVNFIVSTKKNPNKRDNILFEHSEKNISYDFSPENYREILFNISKAQVENLTNKSSLYLHITLISRRPISNIQYEDIIPMYMQQSTIDLLIFKQKKILKEENLLFNDESSKKISDVHHDVDANKSNEVQVENDTNFYPHLRQKVYVYLIHDLTNYNPKEIPPFLNLTINRQYRVYQPILDTRQFWFRHQDLAFMGYDSKAAEPDPDTKNFTIFFNTYWHYKYLMELQLELSFQMHENLGISSESNIDDLKSMILDTNPYFFALTLIVSLLHSVFEFLAIKHDIQFWKNVESHKGLSLRSLYVNFFLNIIIFLYLLDNETSMLVVVPSGIEIFINIWKILKTTKFKKREDGKFPFFRIDHQEAYKSTTAIYDEQATRYLSWVLVPLLICYCIYSLIYEKHKGWYSFCLSTLVGFIYVFGFIQMTPQLYINYKLKSVEHLPWKYLIYKFLNTIIDDLFAFIIVMPWLKRLSCFRDDVIFIIYVFQRFKYKVDHRRTEKGYIPTEEITEGEHKETKSEGEESTADSRIPSGNTDSNVPLETDISGKEKTE